MNWVFLDLSGWDYDVRTPLARPMGGSQSALCYLATALARRGEHVTTLTGIQQPRTVDGVQCLRHEEIPVEVFSPADTLTVVLNGPADVIREIRNVLPAEKPAILWTQHAHDQPASQSLREPAIVAMWDRIVCISDWQQSMFQKQLGVPAEKMAVLRNAISPAFENLFSSPAQLGEAKSKELRLAYTSTPFRGLDLLIACFPSIHRRHPTCRLDVFSSMLVYGQPEAQDPYRALYAQCQKTPGISYRGSVSQGELANELAGVTMLAYPNTFAETSCIAAMEALAAGLLVVSSDLGALPETCGGWARLVPPVSKDRTHEQFAVDFARHADHALHELESDRLHWMQRCFEQSQAINATCTWDVRAAQWQQAAQQWLAAR
ncbi:MAG: glycosyltransferase family 4 protein [Planctomycetia bacterium]|jgi:glycosyltransferase involved in cell wall biosynthesis|nr:glycosyltransferase family 4 protein [Planctomycetia bacterium]